MQDPLKMTVRSDATEHESFRSKVYLICLDAAEKLSLCQDIRQLLGGA